MFFLKKVRGKCPSQYMTQGGLAFPIVQGVLLAMNGLPPARLMANSFRQSFCNAGAL